MTNAHLFKVRVGNSGASLYGMGWVADAKIEQLDAELDLALLSVRSFSAGPISPSQLQSFSFGPKPALNDEVWLLGYSYGDAHTDVAVTRGQIVQVTPVLTTNARASPGNSGGPALNARGEVVGVLRAGMVGASINRNFLISTEVLQRFLSKFEKPLVSRSPGSGVAPHSSTDFEPRCLVVLRVGESLEGLMYAIERDNDRAAFSTYPSTALSWEYMSTSGPKRIAAPEKQGKDTYSLPADWTCPKGRRRTVARTSGSSWSVELPKPWSAPDEATLVRHRHNDADMLFDESGAAVVAFEQPSIPQRSFTTPSVTWGKTGRCRLSMNVSGPGLAVKARVTTERIGARTTTKLITLDPDGTQLDFDLPRCEAPDMLALLRVSLEEPGLPHVAFAVAVTDQLVREPRKFMGMFTAEPDAGLESLKRILEPGPMFLCSGSIVNSKGRVLATAPAHAFSGRRLPSGLISVNNGLLQKDGKVVSFKHHPSSCDVVLPRSGRERLVQESGRVTSWKGDASTLVEGLPGSGISAWRAMDRGYEVLTYAYTGAGPLHQRFAINDGKATLTARYSNAVEGECVLGDAWTIWCKGGQFAPDGQRTISQPYLATCPVIIDSCASRGTTPRQAAPEKGRRE